MPLRGPGCLFRHLAAAPLLLLGRAYYPVGTLERGDRVRVETELFGWYQIRCPEGVFSYVEQKNVNAKGDGSRGEINTDRTAVYAAHADTSKSPAESYRKLLDLERGDVVTIVDTVDNYYRITPPQTAFVFLPPKALAAAEAVAVADPPADSPAESVLPDPIPEPAVEPAPAPAEAPRDDVRLAPVITPDPPAVTQAAAVTEPTVPTVQTPPIDPVPAARRAGRPPRSRDHRPSQPARRQRRPAQRSRSPGRQARRADQQPRRPPRRGRRGSFPAALLHPARG